MRNFLLTAALLSLSSSAVAGIFSWTDASGNIVYGDSPPDTVAAKAVEPPKLTILENFANRYEDPNKPTKSTSNTAQSSQKVNANSASSRVEITKPYTSLKIIAPKADQSIRANDGDVTIAISTEPKLRKGDTVLVYLNGVEAARSSTRVANLKGLDRGEHQLSLTIKNAAGNPMIQSEQISFYVAKNSVITNKNKPYNPYDDDPSQ